VTQGQGAANVKLTIFEGLKLAWHGRRDGRSGPRSLFVTDGFHSTGHAELLRSEALSVYNAHRGQVAATAADADEWIRYLTGVLDTHEATAATAEARRADLAAAPLSLRRRAGEEAVDDAVVARRRRAEREHELAALTTEITAVRALRDDTMARIAEQHVGLRRAEIAAHGAAVDFRYHTARKLAIYWRSFNRARSRAAAMTVTPAPAPAWHGEGQA
jgi:hypothetical protein